MLRNNKLSKRRKLSLTRDGKKERRVLPMTEIGSLLPIVLDRRYLPYSSIPSP